MWLDVAHFCIASFDGQSEAQGNVDAHVAMYNECGMSINTRLGQSFCQMVGYSCEGSGDGAEHGPSWNNIRYSV